MEINLNHSVKVKLTKEGENYLKQRHYDLNLPTKFKLPESDSDGYSTWQLWVLMGHFGGMMQYPSTVEPFENNMILIEKI